ncbi:S-adenosyl-L-methionine-dependent methyltransferase [Mycena rebaudengoi]|nr:S-adenosyl-L-methionine-dependent methyltransferase [Mycena rebaudengoi]
MHAAYNDFLGGKLCFSPLPEQPQKILELGYVRFVKLILSRAIQAATLFPTAQVLAVDLSPLPNRPLPPNLSFQLADLAAPLNFEPETFDIVHSRLVMGYVPNGKEAIARAAKLVKPGGLLLIEDVDHDSLIATGGPAMQRFAGKFIDIASVRGGDMALGRKLGETAMSLGYIQEVHVRKIAIPLSGTGSDEATNRLGAAIRKSWKRLAENFARRSAAEGVTEDMVKDHHDEIDQSGCTTVVDMYFCCARRSPIFNSRV